MVFVVRQASLHEVVGRSQERSRIDETYVLAFF